MVLHPTCNPKTPVQVPLDAITLETFGKFLSCIATHRTSTVRKNNRGTHENGEKY